MIFQISDQFNNDLAFCIMDLSSHFKPLMFEFVIEPYRWLHLFRIQLLIYRRENWVIVCFNTNRDPIRDGWIKEFIKPKWSSGLFWTVQAAEKKNLPTAISTQHFEALFSTFCWQKNIFKFFYRNSSICIKKLHNIKLSKA